MDDAAEWPNLAAMMFTLARRRGNRAMLRHHVGGRAEGGGAKEGEWRTVTWTAFARQTASLARGLRAAGVRPGDRVLLVSESRPEVPMLETALMAIRAVPVPAYTTNTPEDHAHLLLDSGARMAVVSTAALAERVLAGAAHLQEGLRTLWCMDGHAAGNHGLPLLPLLEDGHGPGDIVAEAEAIPASALACLLYTSGTAGLPRGVMLPHRAILSNIAAAEVLARPFKLDGSTYLSFLPLSHSYEHTVGQFLLPALGATVVYGRGLEHLAADMLAVRPTVLTVVPRMMEVIRSRIRLQVGRESPGRQRWFARALAAGERRLDGTRTLGDRLLDPVLDRLVRRKIQARFGGRLVAVISGGARLDPGISRFFDALGVPLLQGYGQTEAGPVVSVNMPGRARNRTVGPPLPGVEVRLAGDGEVLVRGGLVMDGYWGQPEATAAAVQDGWLHTGDVGTMDAQGFITITDRKKDIIVLSGGEKVSPARIEGALMADARIAQAVVMGEGQTGLSALIVPGVDGDARSVAEAVAAVNAGLSVTERVRKHALVPPFTVENGLLTASQKIKRGAVLRAHGGVLRPV